MTLACEKALSQIRLSRVVVVVVSCLEIDHILPEADKRLLQKTHKEAEKIQFRGNSSKKQNESKEDEDLL